MKDLDARLSALERQEAQTELWFSEGPGLPCRNTKTGETLSEDELTWRYPDIVFFSLTLGETDLPGFLDDEHLPPVTPGF